MSLPHHTGDGTAEMTWPWRDVYAVTLAMVLPWQLGHGAMSVPSHARNHAAEVTWSWRDVSVDDHANVAPSLIYT
jgi:hypothetical protein